MQRIFTYLILFQFAALQTVDATPIAAPDGVNTNTSDAIKAPTVGKTSPLARRIVKRDTFSDQLDASDEDYFEYDDYLADIDQNTSHDDGQFLEDLNVRPPGLSVVTDVNLTVGQRDAPEYMLELYDRFSKNHFSHPTSNIVRSFMNINEADILPDIDLTEVTLQGTDTRIHDLVFNITSISADEMVDYGELRLYTLVERDITMYFGNNRKVSVYEVLTLDSESQRSYRLVSSKHLYGKNSGWETYDVTAVVKRWIRTANSMQILEVRIETMFHSVKVHDINASPHNKNEPLLVVFSNDYWKTRLHRKEISELIAHEISAVNAELNTIEFQNTQRIKRRALSNNTRKTKKTSESKGNLVASKGKHREKRSRRSRRNICRRRPSYVHFEDINWHTWIIAPSGYQAYECIGRCYYPLSDHLTPTKHAIVKTLLHTLHSKQASSACCVPTKLSSISLLYVDDQGVITYKYKYDGMVVKECGCR